MEVAPPLDLILGRFPAELLIINGPGVSFAPHITCLVYIIYNWICVSEEFWIIEGSRR